VSVTDNHSATVTQVNSRNVCGCCFRELEPDEAVWLRHISRLHYAAVCWDCSGIEFHWHQVDDGVWANGDMKLFGYYWFEGTCGACSRTVFKKTRYTRRHFFCSRKCEQAYWSLRRRKEMSEKTCEVCSKGFTAKRSDAKTCSAACKQKAYRQRKKIKKEAA
jgi:hypothetical protein